MKGEALALIDDDPIHANLYARALKLGGFDVSYFSTTQSFLDEIGGDSRQKFSAIICDLMMPWGNAFSAEQTQHGLLTGLAVATAVRNHEIKAPIVIFTNMNIESRLSQIEQQVRKLTNVFLLRKSEFNPPRLVDVIQSLLETGKLSERQSSVMRQFFDSLILKPSLFGMGVDLKELFKIKWRD